MPYLNLKLSQALPAHTEAKLVTGLTQLMTDILHKDPALTAITCETVGTWYIHGQPQTQGAYLAIHITQHTNTSEEKAMMIAAAAQLLKKMLGSLPTASYIVIHELPANSWGYDGVTQAQRKV